MEEEAPHESTETFLVGLAQRLSEKEGADGDLADILRAHILKISLAPNAVAKAKDAIVKLAVERAKPPKGDQANG